MKNIKKNFFCVEIFFNKKKQKIFIEENDDLNLIASNFALENFLNLEKKKKLLQILKKKKKLHFKNF